MCGAALPLFVLLWIFGAEGKVAAPASLTAEAGRPLLLGCNISTAAGETISQIRWLNGHSVLLLAYQPTVPVTISHQLPNVSLAPSAHGSSYITIKKVQVEDNGCYQCVFDVFPSGQQRSQTCISVTGKVHLEGNRTAVSGRPISLSCWYSLADRVRQVLWRKTSKQGDSVKVASYSKQSQHTEPQFKGRVRLSPTLGETILSIEQVRMEDEACYTCEFHTFPEGTRSATTCLFVYVLPKPQLSHVTWPSGVTQTNCTTQSRPPADVTWDTGGDNQTLGPPRLSSYEQGDGTTIVTSTLLVQTEPHSLSSLKCLVRHRGLQEPLQLALGEDALRPAIIVLICVCVVAAVLLLSLCVCLCKCSVCTQD